MEWGRKVLTKVAYVTNHGQKREQGPYVQGEKIEYVPYEKETQSKFILLPARHGQGKNTFFYQPKLMLSARISGPGLSTPMQRV